jgi:hypothetical protein
LKVGKEKLEENGLIGEPIYQLVMKEISRLERVLEVPAKAVSDDNIVKTLGTLPILEKSPEVEVPVAAETRGEEKSSSGDRNDEIEATPNVETLPIYDEAKINADITALEAKKQGFSRFADQDTAAARADAAREEKIAGLRAKQIGYEGRVGQAEAIDAARREKNAGLKAEQIGNEGRDGLAEAIDAARRERNARAAENKDPETMTFKERLAARKDAEAAAKSASVPGGRK